jgi:hypothetical protein
MAQVGVIFLNQKGSGRPWFHVSRTTAKQLVLAGTHEWISKNIIYELVLTSTPESSPSRHFISKPVVVPTIAPPTPDFQKGLVLAYPIKDDSSYATYNLQKIWGENCSRLGNPIPINRGVDV